MSSTQFQISYFLVVEGIPFVFIRILQISDIYCYYGGIQGSINVWILYENLAYLILLSTRYPFLFLILISISLPMNNLMYASLVLDQVVPHVLTTSPSLENEYFYWTSPSFLVQNVAQVQSLLVLKFISSKWVSWQASCRLLNLKDIG